ncbi:hypothetical protein K449DRAFT_427466 [Hypoxylon sp. EC38]|nr:hypothetical protein K449DRAFT_427466 [Hypoxylon sp. EC38]
MMQVYREIAIKELKYKFKPTDRIICKYRPLTFKVKDPDFSLTSYSEQQVMKAPNKRGMLSIENKRDNYHCITVYDIKHSLDDVNNNFDFKTKLADVMYFDNNNDFNKNNDLILLAKVYDLKYEDGFIREFIDKNSYNTYIYYDINGDLINIEYECKKLIKMIIINLFLMLVVFMTCIQDIIMPKYNGYIVYAHNGGKFDYNYIFKLLNNNFDNVSRILCKDNSILTFEVKHKILDKNVKIKFLDSYCLLPFSLANLGNSFKVDTIKDIFPYTFVNKDNLNYEGSLEVAIRSAYYGGRCEVFKPYGNNLNAYDFNSLYPYAMLQDLPVGQPTYSLIKDLSKIFGYVKVKITSPDEVKLAEKYGYKVEVIESFIFKRGKDVLKSYVDCMAEIKDKSVGAMRDIHKLLLNTPYGRLGMNNDRDNIQIVSLKDYEKIESTFKLLTVIKLSENKYFVRYSKKPDPIKCDQTKIDFDVLMLDTLNQDFVNNSPAIAAAIAS